jgi:hypothetical protein
MILNKLINNIDNTLYIDREHRDSVILDVLAEYSGMLVLDMHHKLADQSKKLELCEIVVVIRTNQDTIVRSFWFTPGTVVRKSATVDGFSRMYQDLLNLSLPMFDDIIEIEIAVIDKT